MDDENVPEGIINIQNNLRLYLAIIIIFNFFIIFFLKLKQKALEKFKEFGAATQNKQSLIIIPKLDDFLYFYPSIKTLTSQEYFVNIFSLTKPDELVSKSIHGLIKQLNISFCENDKLKLNDCDWDEEIVFNEIECLMSKYTDVGNLITFDENGLSDKKRMACYNGLIKYLLRNKEKVKEMQVQIYNLDSFKWFNSYTLIFPAIYFYFKIYGFFNSDFKNTYELMNTIKLGFLTKISKVLSSYTYYNSLTKIEFKD